jgi:N-acetylglucosaminyl-diphospho-decaprenol L-rhamnosyltransferase
MPPPEVAAVVGNYGGEHLLGDCVASLRAQTLPPAEILVVDGASADASVAVARELGVRVLERENRGLGHLYDEGVRATGAELVLLLNNDVALEPECLEQLAAALAADDSRFAADPRQVDWEGRRTLHARTTLARGRLLREAIPGFRLDHVVAAEGVVPTVSGNGAALLVRRDLLLDLGGFDETFFLEWEELDLCWRAWLRGNPTVYVPDAVVRHRVGAATGERELPRRVVSSHHNLLRFALKCLPPAAAARVVAGELLRAPRRPRAALAAFAAVARELPEILRERRRVRPSSAHLDWVLAGMPAR